MVITFTFLLIIFPSQASSVLIHFHYTEKSGKYVLQKTFVVHEEK